MGRLFLCLVSFIGLFAADVPYHQLRLEPLRFQDEYSFWSGYEVAVENYQPLAMPYMGDDFSSLLPHFAIKKIYKIKEKEFDAVIPEKIIQFALSRFHFVGYAPRILVTPDLGRCRALYHYATNTILVSTVLQQCPYTVRLFVLLHELAHAYQYEYGLATENNAFRENQADRIACSLTYCAECLSETRSRICPKNEKGYFSYQEYDQFIDFFFNANIYCPYHAKR